MATAAANNSTKMEMKENQSIVDEGMSTTRLVTKQDGTKVAYSQATLRQAIENQLGGLNQDFINVDIILTKVASGLYNGKPYSSEYF